MEPKLAAAIEEFKVLHPEYALPLGAESQCKKASAAFADLLLAKGIIQLRCRGSARSNWEVMEVDWEVYRSSHYAFRMGNLLIDWTARQFISNADWPKVEILRMKHPSEE